MSAQQPMDYPVRVRELNDELQAEQAEISRLTATVRELEGKLVPEIVERESAEATVRALTESQKNATIRRRTMTKTEDFLTISETVANGLVFHVHAPKSEALRLYAEWLQRAREALSAVSDRKTASAR